MKLATTTTISCWFFLLFLAPATAEEIATPLPTVSPQHEFVASPRNVTVLEGHPAVLRCKLTETVHNCQWFYLELGLDIFDTHSEPLLITEFRPTKSKDCTIKFEKTKVIQTGQWMCKGLQIHARKYVVSRPAILQVIERKGGEDEIPETLPRDGNEDTIATDISFHIENEDHIINTNLGDTAILGCQANKELKSCSWIRPDGTTLRFDREDIKYTHEGNFTDGNCSLKIIEVSARDEGNWRCVVSTSGKGDKLGPLIHLHILQFGLHAEDFQGIYGSKENNSSLVIILVTTSVVLLIIIISLIVYMYKYVWKKNSPQHKYLESHHGTNSEYSHYGSTWLPGMPSKDQNLIGNSEMNISGDFNTPNNRYIDMSGNKKGYVVFPESSVRSSMSSGTTLSTIQVGQNALVESDKSARTSNSDSLHSVSTFGNSIDKNNMRGRELPQRSDSVYSNSHLYEEIDETKMRKAIDEEHLPNYANTDEDQEGYMIPKSRSQDGTSSDSQLNSEEVSHSSVKLDNSTNQRAPPYSKVGESGLVPDSDSGRIATNHTYTSENPPETEESYDAPHDPPVPVRTDSADNPLAAYDVPKHASNENFVFDV